jgi:putative FmdB family regulatory protein
MPVYDYRCTNCGYTDIVLQLSLDNPKEVNCVKCGEPMKRLFPSNVMIKMKGEGGYPSRHKQVFNTTNRNHPNLE